MAKFEESEEDLPSVPHMGADPHRADGPLDSATTAIPESREKINSVALEEEKGDSPEAHPLAEEEEEGSPAKGEPVASVCEVQPDSEQHPPHSAPFKSSVSYAAEGPVSEDVEMDSEGGRMHALSVCTSLGFRGPSCLGFESQRLAGGPDQPRTRSLAHTPVPGDTCGGNLAHPQAEEEEEGSPTEGEPARKVRLEWQIPHSTPSERSEPCAAEGSVSEEVDMEKDGMHALVASGTRGSLGFGGSFGGLGFGVGGLGSPGLGFRSESSGMRSGMASSREPVSSSGLEDDLGGLGDSCDGSNGGHNDPAGVSEKGTNAELTMKGILDALRCGRDPSFLTPKLPSDSALELWKDHKRLGEACRTLTTKSRDLRIDVALRTRLTGMVGVLNLYLDPQIQYNWTEASLVVARVQGSGVKKARKLRKWILDFIQVGELPSYKLGQSRSILEDEDIKGAIQLELMECAKGKSISAVDIVNIVATPRIQDLFSHAGITKPRISERTARRWLTTLEWQYGLPQKGMYVDGHEREDVVKYRQAFIERWKQYERHFHLWDNDRNLLPLPNGFPVPGALGRFHLILVTHDESTFFQNDLQKSRWSHKGDKPTPSPKGDGQSVMVSDFLTADWGRLCDGDESV